MTIATAIRVDMLTGASHLIIEPDGFISDGLIAYLQQEFKEDYLWISTIEVKALGWDIETLDLVEVYEDIYSKTKEG